MRRRQIAAAGAAAAVLVGGGIAYAQAQGATGSYRTAKVALGDVDKTLSLAGTITASTRQDLSFGAAGTISAVKVEAGDEVASGDVLARLDPTDLETSVTKARATLAKARAQLESDQASQAETVTEAATPAASTSTTTPKATAPSPSKPTATPSPSPALKAALQKLATQQTDVTVAQTAATEAITAAKSALATQVEACKVAEEADPVDPALTAACDAALDAVQAAQDVVAEKQDVLQKSLEALSATLATAVNQVGQSGSSDTKTPTPTPTPTKTATPTESSVPAESTTSTKAAPGGGGTVTAASLAKDQASIDTAKAEVTEAKRALKSAKLIAPFAGEILSVSATKGDAMSASDAVIVIVGDGATTVTTTVTLEQVDDVERGQTAAVTPAGAAESVSGTVTSIGLLPTTGTDTSTYPVTIDLEGEVAAPEGSTASVQITIGTAADVLTVPSSAVSTMGRTTVSVLKDGNPVITPVTVGIVGPTRTSITEGLKKGQEVVLANLDAELPSGDSTSTRLPGSGGGGFSGGGMGGQRGPRG